MSKKKITVIVITLIVIAAVLATGVWYLVKTVNAKFEQDKTRIIELKAELIEEKSAHKKAKRDLEDAIDTLAFTEEELMEMTKNFDKVNALYQEAQSEETVSEEVSTPEPTPAPTEAPVSTQTSTSEETPMYTEFDDGKCYMDIYGTFIEPGSGRVRISITPHDASAPDDYLVTIQGSNGAADNSTWALTANWDAGSSSLIYQGVKTNNVNGVITTYDGITGSLRFDDPDTLYWTDESTGNYDRGPFTKQ